VSITKLSISLLFLSLIVITIVGFLIKPINLHLSLFFSLLAWSYFLVIINWYSLIFAYADTNLNNKNNTKFGILPSIGIQVIIFTLVSFAIAVFFLTANNFDQLPLKHWLIQFALLGIFLAITVMSLIAAKTAELPEIDRNLKSKDYLINLIDETIIILENDQKNQEKINTLRLIKDSIKYSIPNLAVLKDTDKYISISECLHTLLVKSKSNEHIEINELNTILSISRICK
jgi:hypothetical protein